MQQNVYAFNIGYMLNKNTDYKSKGTFHYQWVNVEIYTQIKGQDILEFKVKVHLFQTTWPPWLEHVYPFYTILTEWILFFKLIFLTL